MLNYSRWTSKYSGSRVIVAKIADIGPPGTPQYFFSEKKYKILNPVTLTHMHSSSCTERTQYFHGSWQTWHLLQTQSTWENVLISLKKKISEKSTLLFSLLGSEVKPLTLEAHLFLVQRSSLESEVRRPQSMQKRCSPSALQQCLHCSFIGHFHFAQVWKISPI